MPLWSMQCYRLVYASFGMWEFHGNNIFSCKNLMDFFFFLSKMPICHAITLANNCLVSRMTFFLKVLPNVRLPFSTMQGGCYDLYSGYYPLLKQFHVYLPSKCLTLTILIVITRAYCQETCKTHTTLFI